MQFRILGPLEVGTGHGGAAVETPKLRALLGVLLLHANEVVSRERLIDELWGARPPATAPKLVQTYVSQLRRELGPATIQTRAPGYLLPVGDDQLDAARFRRLAAEGRRLVASDDREGARRVYREALGLWRGPPLADVLFESFARNEVGQLEEERLSSAMELIDCELALGRHAEVAPELEMLVSHHPLRERFRAQLMLALYRAGRQAEALAVYQNARRTLVDELGVEPGPALQALQRAILRQEPALTPAPWRGTAGRLPSQPTPFVGRTREVAQIVGLLRRADLRLLTLSGAGGSGKTRLALRAASEVAPDYPDGVFWVPLATLRDPAQVLTSIAQVLLIADEQELARWIGERRLLLVLDNCEHLLTAAPTLAELMATSPNLRLLVTSREPLHLTAEREFLVPTLAEDDAIELFRQRAYSAEPELVVRAICRRLDCLPLAIELAAARTKLLPPHELLQRLDRRLPLLTGGPRDAPERQRSLEATIAWSYHLLDRSERRLLALLSVFAGGCTLDAAESVCEADLDTLQSLVDKSLLRREGDRFSMLETIREYAAETMRQSFDTDDIGARHMAYYLALVEHVDQRIRADDPELGRLHATLATEYDNLWAALTWAVDHGHRGCALRLAAAARPLNFARTLADARKAFETAWTAEGATTPAVEARALLEAGIVACESGDPESAVSLGEESLALYRAVGDPKRVAGALRWLGTFLGAQGRPDAARRALRRSIALSRRIGFAVGYADAVHFLGELELREARVARAATLLADSVDLHTTAGRGDLAAHARHALGDARLEQGDSNEAARLYRESLAQFQRVGDRHNGVPCFGGLAAAAAESGDIETAGRLWAVLVQYEHERGTFLDSTVRCRYERRLAAIDADSLALAVEHSRRMSFDEAVEDALTTGDLAS